MDAVLLLKRQGIICVGKEYIPRSPLEERDVILDVNGCTMFDDLVLVLQEYTSEYEGRYQEDKTKSEVCQAKKLHLYSAALFPISLYLPHNPVPYSPYPCTLPHNPVPFSPYPCTLRSTYRIKKP